MEFYLVEHFYIHKYCISGCIKFLHAAHLNIFCICTRTSSNIFNMRICDVTTGTILDDGISRMVKELYDCVHIEELEIRANARAHTHARSLTRSTARQTTINVQKKRQKTCAYENWLHQQQFYMEMKKGWKEVIYECIKDCFATRFQAFHAHFYPCHVRNVFSSLSLSFSFFRLSLFPFCLISFYLHRLVFVAAE